MEKEDNEVYIGKVVGNKEILFYKFIKNKTKKSNEFILGVLG